MAEANLLRPMHDDMVEESHWRSEPFDLTDDVRARLIVGTAASGDRPNEDAYGVHLGESGLHIVTFDGATSLIDVEGLPEDTTGARFASHFLRDEFYQIVAETPDISPREMILELNSRLFAKYMSLGIHETETYLLPGSTMTHIYIGRTAVTAEFAHVGDGLGWTHSIEGSSALFTEDRNAPFDKSVLNLMGALVFEGRMTPREARQHPDVVEALLKGRKFKDNNPDGKGTGIINSDPNVWRYVQSDRLDLKTLKMLIVATDGLLPSLLDPQREEYRGMVYKYLRETGSFADVISRTRSIEDADPDFWNMRLKHSDDATGIALEVLTN